MRFDFFILLLSLISAERNFSEATTPECYSKISPGMNFLKGYVIDGDHGNKPQIEYTYVFTKGTTYSIQICSGELNPDGVIVTLFDSKRNKLASSKIDDVFLKTIAYTCNTTGIYYMRYTFEKPTNFYAESILTFRKDVRSVGDN